jgi:hypothetical protein
VCGEGLFDMNNAVMLVADGPYTDVVNEDGGKVTKAVVMYKVLEAMTGRWVRINRKYCLKMDAVEWKRDVNERPRAYVKLGDVVVEAEFSRRKWLNLDSEKKDYIKKCIENEKVNIDASANVGGCGRCACSGKCESGNN